ncbi:MAG: tetratricopeptide repeat protein [Alphaproteobacteria bacterium]|nr:tetratricopeptide repeat protein [Alphaproteobacteria bacterium]
MDEAVACLREAAMLAPLVPDLHLNLGVALMHLGRFDEAATAFQKALKLDRAGPDTAALYNNLGVARRGMGRLDDAVPSFRRAIAADGGLVDAVKNLSMTLTDLLRTDDALAALDRGLARAPQAAVLHAQRAHALKERGDVDAAMAAMDEARRLAPDDLEILTSRLLLAQYQDGVTAERLRALHEDYGRRLAARVGGALTPPVVKRPAGRPLRVGYVSGDLRRHPVGFFMAAVVPHHDRARVAPVIYSCHPHADGVTRRIQAGAAEWHQVHNVSDAALAELVGAHSIDLLIDLSGHTSHHRLGTFARKPAPVQATWAGYVGTTGLEAIDYLIADRFHVPEGWERHHVERVIRLPNGSVCWLPPDTAPAVGPLPAPTRGHVRFASFNNIAKITPRAVATWATILKRVPGAKLALRTKTLGDPGTRSRYLGLFAAQGVGPERLDMGGELPQDELLAAYGSVDIALDPFPYSGGVTTLEALWMGVPVVTTPGESHAGRHSTSHLANAGHPELVARDLDGYVDLAVGLAQDLPALADLRQRLRPDMAASPLLDHAGFARDLETVFETMCGV